MKELVDAVTSSVKIATDILFVRNPVGTSMGAVFGVALHGIAGLFSPLLQTFEFIRISALSVFHYVAFGIFGFNIKRLKNYHKVSPEVEEAIRFIELQAKKGNITKLEARQKYRELIAKVVDNVRLDKEVRESISIVRGFDEKAK